METIYKIEIIASIGFIDDHSYYKNLSTALKAMKALVSEKKKQCRADNSLAKGEDIPKGSKNGVVEKKIDKKSEWDKDILYEAAIFSWYKCSYEYDEWDVSGEVYRIKQIELK